jgi:hypothetical protein
VTCPSCGADSLSVFYEVERVPVHSCRLVATREEAVGFAAGELRLAVCGACGFVTNVAFDPSLQDYSIAYEETQAFSPHFNEFLSSLARRWVERYDLRGKSVLEIGSGKGEFLVLLAELGIGRGIGLDPGFVPERVSREAAERIEFIRDYYGERYAGLAADAIVCRHTLEHIHPVGDFMRLIRRSLDGRDPVLLFELPDVLRVLREGAFWDLYYEHASYFSPGSLARLFRLAGFRVLDLELVYDGQYILIEADPGDGSGEAHELEDDPADVVAAAEEFRRVVAAKLETSRRQLEQAERPVIWGAGSKGVSFLTTLGAESAIRFAVDVNPFKHGMFIAGTGHEIVAPDFLREYRPDLVIAMNPVYRGEIGRALAAIGVDARLEPV